MVYLPAGQFGAAIIAAVRNRARASSAPWAGCERRLGEHPTLHP
jgi:hypothetical protein